MISMQRSFSSPVRVHTSPTISPDVVRESTLSTEPNVQLPDDLNDSPQADRQSSRSPHRREQNAAQRLPRQWNETPDLRREDEGSKAEAPVEPAPSRSQMPTTIPEVNQGDIRTLMSSYDGRLTPKATNGNLGATNLTRPLLQDTSLYSNPHLTRQHDSTTLEELAHLVRLSKYQERKRANTRIRLQKTLVATALNARLTRCGDIAYRNLVDSFRKDENQSFAALYNAVHDVRKSCDELRRYAILEPDMESMSSPILGSNEATDLASDLHSAHLRSATPFLHDIAAASRETFLNFVTQIRTNPDYLATRICALTSSELNAFLVFHKGLEPIDSVLPFHARSSFRSQNTAGSRHNAASDIDRLLSFHRHDALSILIHTCFANSAGPDSIEDRRRTEVWATALARLITEPKSSSENFVISVLSIWTTMRDWSGKSNMEWYLMKILEDGAFLLDRAEDQHGTRFNLSDWNKADEAAAKEFYDRAVDGLFELIDDEDGTGIPEGLLELGNAILSKLSGHQFVKNTSRWLAWKCLFYVFLVGVIVHPESYGMLADYHITPYAREKILKKVAMKAHEYVSTMWGGKPSAIPDNLEIPVKIRGHVESILARFQGNRSKAPAAKLLPARSITSLRETAEVHPYLVVSPSDLVTLVNALFPDGRPMSSASMRSPHGSFSGRSGSSRALAMNLKNTFETASIISTIASTASSEASTSKDDLSEYQRSPSPASRHSPSRVQSEAERKARNFEDDGYQLRLAVDEMSHSLGTAALQGSSHPCAERWSVLFVSSDGRRLSTHMTYDPDDEAEEEDHSSSSDTDDDDYDDSAQLDKDYHQLRDSILKLVEEYEIPQKPEQDGEGSSLSNRASRLRRYKSKNRIITPEPSRQSRNPYRQRIAEETPASGLSAAGDNGDLPPQGPEKEATLVTMLKAAGAQSKAQADFVSAHMYWKTLNQLNALESPSLRRNEFSVLINIFSRGPRDSIRRSASAIEEYDAWLVWLKQSQERHEGSIERMMKRVRAMRDKMWYVAEVRNSKEYAHSRDICQALKSMGMPRRWNSQQRSRSNATRGGGPNYLYRAESQIMDLVAAKDDQGGPNKLSDDQAELTSQWLKQYGIENFCQGEERIHRFCCEVDRCIKKLVAETLRDAPVLWSSELFKRDKLVFDRLRARERDIAVSSDDTSSILSDHDRRFGASPQRPTHYGRDARSLSGHRMSQQSFDSLRLNVPRTTANIADMFDNHDYFDRASSANPGDSGSTFWSPFQPAMSPGSGGSRAYSPTTSLTNLSTTFSGHPPHGLLPSNSSFSTGRPETSASSNETIFQRRNEDEKQKFLNELKQSLTSLMLSDLGTQVFSKGSETDGWFHGLGQECIDRKGALDKRARQKLGKRDTITRSSTRPRVIEKKKSFGNLRDAGEKGQTHGEVTEGQTTPSSSTPTGPATPLSAMMASTKDDFPFRGAYQRLLSMFRVHPNPYAKLMALKELENLIVASVSASGAKRIRWNRSDAGSSVVEDNSVDKRPTSLDELIDNVKERRSLAMLGAIPPTSSGYSRQTNAETRSIMSVYTTHTDAVANELQNLFRDASIRPQTLFRDLQLIAAFVPPSILDRPELGKAFWNAGIAALKLKAEVCGTMVEMADEVVAAKTHGRNVPDDTTTPDIPISTSGTPPPPSNSYSLEDAGRMWTITAKEGSPTAQRELALFYLSNSEYVERTTLPLSKPREVFKQVVMAKYGRTKANTGGGTGVTGPHAAGTRAFNGGAGVGLGDGKSSGTNEGDVRNDPGLMCVAVHWMGQAEQGGDELATSFLRQNEFMEL